MSEIGITEEQVSQKGRDVAGKGLSWTASDLGWHIGFGVCVFAGLLLLYGVHYPIHHDLAGSVLSGRLTVTLGNAYGDYSIYFPPVERVWFSIAARLSELTGMRLDLAVVAMTGVMVLISAELAYRIRRATVGAPPLFFVLSVTLLVILPILFKNVFGLREHIVALGLWPYLVLRVSDPDGTRISPRTRAILGIWMGATLLFKYLYAVVVFLVELTDALVQRRPLLLFRTENIVSGSVVALYLFCWLGLDPSQRTAIGAMFSAIDANLADPTANWMKVVENLGYVAGFFALLIGFRVPWRLILLGLATAIGAIIVAWSQERWYTHHQFPIILTYVFWWWATERYFRWWGHVAVALGLAYPLVTQFFSTFGYQKQVAEVDRAISDAGLSVKGKRVGILNMHPSPYNQYLASHGAVRWNALANTAYVAADLKPFDTRENAGKLPHAKLKDPGRQMLHDQMLRLWEDLPPDALILDDSGSWPLRYVDVEWSHVYSEDPRFNAILKDYRPVLMHKGKRMSFTYYVRAD